MCICHPDPGPPEVSPEGWALQPQQDSAPGAGGPAGAWQGSLSWTQVLGSEPTTVDVFVVKTQLCYNYFVQVKVYITMLCGYDGMFTEFML